MSGQNISTCHTPDLEYTPNMPYIKPQDRPLLNKVREIQPLDAGQLNFVITRLTHGYLEREGTSYRTLNEVIGVLECSKLEIYRRVVAPYEDGKISVNGDVLPHLGDRTVYEKATE